MITSQYFNITSNASVFASNRHIANKQHCSVWVKSLSNVWTQIPYNDYDLVNNSIILDTALLSTIYSQVELRVADSQEELGTPVTDISSLASIKDKIEIASNNIDSISTIADNINDISDIANNISKAGIVADNINDVIKVANDIDNVSQIVDYSIEAMQWAENDYGVEVKPNKYSSKHWAIVSQNNNSVVVKIATNIAELKTISINYYNQVEILGYYSKGDGGGGLFYWDNTSTETDNGGTIIQATGITTGRWKRIYTKLTREMFDTSYNYSLAIKQQNQSSSISYLNKYGRHEETLIQNNNTGRLYNPQINNNIFGIETLQYWFSLFAQSNNQNNGSIKGGKIVCTGDSTTYGVGGTYGGVPGILLNLSKSRGYTNVSVVNNGRSSEPLTNWIATNKTTSWESTYLAADLAANPDLLIVRWGANDPFYNVVPLGSSSGVPYESDEIVFNKVVEAYRRCLNTIRSTNGKGVDKLSILLVSPGMMNDVHFGRDEVYFTKLNNALKEIAIEFQCAYVDTISTMPNSWGGAGLWMDSDSASGTARAVHPLDIQYEHIARMIADACMPNDGINWKVNTVINTSGTSVNRLVGDLPIYYFAGINIDRFEPSSSDASGKQYNGISTTIKQADGAVLQIITPLKGGNGQGIALRKGFNNQWDDYLTGASYDILTIGYSNGWANIGNGFELGRFKKTLDGYVHLSGVITGGTKTDGTLICTLPAGFRPIETVLTLAATELGTCIVSIANTGAVKVYRFGTGGTYMSLNNVSFQAFQ